uniref:Protein kinase domain-containing protein n=1 Tax=Guillardia theta TaxID=55529 RepID=A0A6U6BS37_GUITH|mmetsp:Transcript_41140/g.129217  ORF Transcript_41140/g.129217 Transcript_41140/m.129217 type:complete len:652 (+) Transcript_41140:190-2145(+)
MAAKVMSNEIELERLFAASASNSNDNLYELVQDKSSRLAMRCNLFEIADGCKQEPLSVCPVSESVEASKNELSEPLNIPHHHTRTSLCRSNSMTELDRHGRGDALEDSQLLEIDGEFVLRPLPERPGSLQSNPYIGTFHHGHQANRLPRSSISSEGSSDSFLNCSSCSCILSRSESCCSDRKCANLNRAARAASSAIAKSACCSIPQRNFFLPSSSAEVENEKWSPPRRCSPEEKRLDVKIVDTKDHKTLMKQALKLQEDIPASAELCGLQALLPKQAGVRVLQLIGEGSFGKCVKVVNKRNCQSWNVTEKRRHLFSFPQEGEQLAIKCVYRDPGTASGSDSIDREIRVHGKCDHPNIVKLYGYYELGATVALILGFVEGSELHDVLQISRRLEEEVCASIFLQILRAVDHMHSMSIIHRDIKPRNVLLATSGRAYVIDLGLAVDLSDQSDTAVAHEQTAAGTIGYLPPEVLQEEEEAINFAMDIWALGITLYEMMFGFSPFLPHEVALPAAVEFPDPSWGMVASSDMRELIMQLLEKNPRKRIRSADALLHRWFTAERVTAVDKLVGPAQSQGAAAEGVGREDAMSQLDEEMQFDLELNEDLSMELDMRNRVSGEGGDRRANSHKLTDLRAGGPGAREPVLLPVLLGDSG